GRALVLAGFPSLESSLRGANLSVSSGPAACELIDRRLLALARSSSLQASSLIPAGAEAVLLVEFEAETLGAAHRAAADLAHGLYDGLRLAVQPLVATESEQIDRCWELREAALPGLYNMRGGVQPLPFIEDVGVPPEELAVYLHRVHDI